MKRTETGLPLWLKKLAVKAIICMVFGVVSVSASSAATLSWGGVQHRVGSDNIGYDTLDVGISSDATTFAGMTLAVAGPNGFTYSFTGADIIPWINGQLALQKKYLTPSAALQPGAYTFTLNDGQGHISQRVDTHVTVSHALPRVDSATIQLQRKANGSYRVSWAPLNDTRTYFYCLRIDNAATNSPVYFSPRTVIKGGVLGPYMESFVDLPVSSAILDNTSYRVRVEASDAADFDTTTNGSDSAYVNFNPVVADYVPARLLFDFAYADNRIDPGNAGSTEFGFLVNSPDAITSAVLTGPDAFSYTFNLVSDKLPGKDFWKKFTTPLSTGTYRFDVVANGIHNYAYATLTSPVVYPYPDVSSYKAEYVSSDFIRFSFADVNYDGALDYQVIVEDSVTGMSVASLVANQTYFAIGISELGDLASKKWRVEVADSTAVTTRRNRVIGPLSSATLANIPPYTDSQPATLYYTANNNNFGIYNDLLANGTTVANIWMGSRGVDASITELRVDGPGGYTRNLLTAGKLDGSVYRLQEAGALATGLYTFTVVDTAAHSAVRYNYQPAPVQFPSVDFKSFKVVVEGGNARFSWAPVESTIPLWYTIQYLADTDADNNGEPDSVAISGTTVGPGKSSVSVPLSALGTVKYFRIFAADGSHFTTINNRSRSVIVGYEAPGFDYSTLSNADGDAYASNADADDNNPAVFPFASAVFATITSPANGSTLTGATQTFTWAGVGADKYQIWVGTIKGASNLGMWPPAGTTNLSTIVTGLTPTGGGTLYVRLWSLFGSNWGYNDYTYTVTGAPVAPATMVTPTSPSALASGDQVFTWTNAGADKYQIWVGTTQGTSGLGMWPPAGTTGTSTTVTGLAPTGGGTLYVRLWSLFGSNWMYNDYTYTVSGTALIPAAMITPTSPSALASGDQVFTWTNAGADKYQIWVGTTQGTSGLGMWPPAGTTGTSTTVTGLAPTGGGTLYVRLWSLFGSNWIYNDYTYTVTGTALTPAAMITPTSPSALSSGDQVFTWTNAGADKYQIWVGTTQGTSGLGMWPPAGTTGTSTTVAGLAPTGGGTLYVRLWSLFGSNWLYNDYTYTVTGTALTPAAMITPTSPSALSSGNQTFTWTNAGADKYQIWVGTTQGTSNLGMWPPAGTTGTSTTVTGLAPTGGGTLYVRLWSSFGSNWIYNDYTYTVQ